MRLKCGFLSEMLGQPLKLPRLSRAVKPRNSELSCTRDSCWVTAMPASSCSMYSSRSSVRFTYTRAPTNYCPSRAEPCLTKAGFWDLVPASWVESSRGERPGRNILSLLSVLIPEGLRTVSLTMTCFSSISSKSSSPLSSLDSLSEESQF